MSAFMIHEDTDPPLGSSVGGVAVSNGPRTRSVPQAFLTALRVRLKERCDDLEHLRTKALESQIPTDDDPEMKHHFYQACCHLNEAGHRAMAVTSPLAQAEHHIFEFQAAVEKSAGRGTREPGSDDPHEHLQYLLRGNKLNAAQAEVTTLQSTFWNVDLAKHYHERAKMLESTFVERGDEHAVFVLLEADWGAAKTAFTNETMSDSSISGAYQVHRDAMERLHKLINDMRDIPGLEI